MSFYKYLGEDHTLVKTKEQGPKIKVVQGEIFETNLPKENFMGRRFIEVDKKGNSIDSRNSQFDGITANSSDLHDKTIKTGEVKLEEDVVVTTEDDGKADITISVENPQTSTPETTPETSEETKNDVTPVNKENDAKNEENTGSDADTKPAYVLTVKEEKEIVKTIKSFEVEEDYRKYVETLSDEQKANEKIAQAIVFMDTVFVAAKQ